MDRLLLLGALSLLLAGCMSKEMNIALGMDPDVAQAVEDSEKSMATAERLLVECPGNPELTGDAWYESLTDDCKKKWDAHDKETARGA